MCCKSKVWNEFIVKYKMNLMHSYIDIIHGIGTQK